MKHNLTPIIKYEGPSGSKKYWTKQGINLLNEMEVLQPGLGSRSFTKAFPNGAVVCAKTVENGDMRVDTLNIKVPIIERKKQREAGKTEIFLFPVIEAFSVGDVLDAFYAARVFTGNINKYLSTYFDNEEDEFNFNKVVPGGMVFLEELDNVGEPDIDHDWDYNSTTNLVVDPFIGIEFPAWWTCAY